MEAEDKDERFRKLGFKPQKENVYNKLLPYADKLDEESTKLFTDIKTNLVKSVLAREIRPGCALWTSRLNKYLKVYGLKFSKEDHVALIKLFYSLLTIPNLEPIRINKFASTFSQLLKKRYLLSQEDLQLEWRPLYDLCVQVMEKSKTELGMYRYYTNLEHNIENLIRYARIYFPTKATQEILDEFRPRLCPFTSTDITSAIEYLELFLPLNVKPEEAEIGYNLWYEEFMNLWTVCHNASMWENNMAWLMARLASKNMGYINWEPHIPIMFSRFLRTLNLPVTYRQKVVSKQYKIDANAMCLWIVCTLHEGSSAFLHLEIFMQTIETYLHPANTGRWTNRLLEFLRRISFLFVQRIHCEREKKPTWEVPIPDHYKLNDQHIDRFVNILKPCLQQAIFSRGISDISFSLQYLAALRPNIIVPIVLEKLYSSMDSLTEPHKYTSSMMCLKSVVRYMVQGKKNNYPEGPTHAIPLLQSLLPGIDPNDIRKCFMTFTLMLHIVNVVPLVDSSEACNYFELTDEEHLICEASAGLEDFVIQLLDRLCAWVESNALEVVRMEQADSDRNSRSETLGENMVYSVIYSLLTQCSPQIYMSALKKMYNFVTSRILETKVSGRLVAIACQGFVRANPKEAMKLFMPHLCDTVLRLLTENEDSLKDERLDNELAYNMLILSEIVDARGEVVHYMDILCKILDKTLHMRSLQGSNMAARMLHLMTSSLTFMQPEESRSCSQPYTLPVKDFLTIREWGNPGNLHNLNISWYVPGEIEIKCIETLVHRYLIPELETLEKYSNGEITLTREVLRRTLKIVVAMLGSHPVLPLWEEPSLQLVESVLDPWEFELIVGGPHIVVMPDGRNIRKAIADCLHKVQKRILEVDEGDTKSIQNIVTIYDILLFHRFRYRDFQSRWKSFHALKKSSEDRLHQKKLHLRHVLIDRVQLHQEFRNESRCCFFTQTHKQILLDLFELSVSRYSEVRCVAQSQLFCVVSTFPYSYSVLTSNIKEILHLDPTDHHEKFKGCLYVLIGPKGAPIVSRHNWLYIKDLWPLVVKSKPSEKPSIVNLMNNLLESVHRLFPTISINLEIPAKCIDAAYSVANVEPKSDLSGFSECINESEDKLKQICSTRRTAYEETVNSLIDAAISGNLHWRYHSMALSFIRELVHPDVKYNARVVKFFLNALINESLNIRKIALRVVIFILVQNKPKFKKDKIDPFSVTSVGAQSTLEPGIRPDNQWLIYNRSNVPKTSEDWEKSKFVHNQYIGFYCWPKELSLSSPSSEQVTPAKRMNNLSEEEKEIYAFFSDKTNIATLIKYFSLEEKKGRDQFNAFRVLVFKNLFKMYEDLLMDIFLSHLQTLVNDKQEQSQRCAAEIISGIIRGSKHWSFDKLKNMWSVMLPILKTAFTNMCDETMSDWVACVGMALDGRDPRSVYWFLEFLLDDPLAEQSSLVGCGRIIILQQALNQQPWRNPEMIHTLLQYFYNYLNHPFQNVRDKISGALCTIFSKDIEISARKNYKSPYPKIKDFFQQITPKLIVLNKLVLDKMGHSNGHVVHKTELKPSTNHVNNICSKDNEWEESVRLFKIVARYVINSIMQVSYSAVPEFYTLIPLASVLQSNDLDDELENISACLLAVLSHCLTLEQYIPDILRTLKDLSECPFWSARAVVPEFLQVFVFHNMATIVPHSEWVLKIQSIVLTLLEDVQLEVRSKARHVLSDFLHCHFIPNPMEILELFKQKAKTKIKKRKDTKEANCQDNNNAIRLRHAGVLGLSAFISSHPYDVPDFLPSIFSELSPHLNDPQPIPTTIRKILGDFKRTHHDNWETHKLKFTEEELSVISDLTVPPSYYA